MTGVQTCALPISVPEGEDLSVPTAALKGQVRVAVGQAGQEESDHEPLQLWTVVGPSTHLLSDCPPCIKQTLKSQLGRERAVTRAGNQIQLGLCPGRQRGRGRGLGRG